MREGRSARRRAHLRARDLRDISQSLWYPAPDGPRHNKAQNEPRQYNTLDNLWLLGRTPLLQPGMPLAVARNALVCGLRNAQPCEEIFGWVGGKGRRLEVEEPPGGFS